MPEASGARGRSPLVDRFERKQLEKLAEAIVVQAMEDAEGIIKYEWSGKINKSIPGAIRSCPQVNLTEIREFMEGEFFMALYDTDGGRLFDSFIKYLRTEKYPLEYGR